MSAQTHPPIDPAEISPSPPHPAAPEATSGAAAAEAAPLSFGQRRLWFLHQLEPGSPLHHLAELVRLHGVPDAEALERSLEAVIGRHEALRTTFLPGGAEPVQLVARRWTFRLDRTDLRAVEADRRESELGRLVHEESRRPFDLRRDLLLRARLFQLDETGYALLLVLHHIAADGWSMAPLYRELGECYNAFRAGGRPLLSAPSLQYADHARWQRGHLQGETLRRLAGFWRRRLGDAPPLLSLPTDRPRPAGQAHRGAICTALYPAELVERLHSFSRGQRTTFFVTLLAAFKVLLHRYTGQEDIVVGSPLAGRERAGMEGLIGHFANTLVLRTDLAGDPDFIELLARVRDTMLAAHDHKELPFEKLVEELDPRRDPSYDPVCQVLFALQDAPPAPPRLPGLDTTIEPVHTGTARADLSVWASEGPTGLRVRAEYNLELFDAGTVGRLLGHFGTLLEAIADSPARRISHLPLLTPAEQTRLLREWNATAVEYPRHLCIPAVFAEQVARTPQATALVFNDRELSYAELDRRSDALARRLRACNVKADTPVGLCSGRSLEMVVGLLGILKAGGAYVPLDPDYPKERLAFMLEDSGAPMVVAQRHRREMFPERISVICLDDDFNEAAPNVRDGGASAAGGGADPHSLAYVLYTSGSTGRPKGVMVSHRNVLNFFAGMDRVLGSGPGVWLAVTSISFDISVLEIFWTLTRGFKVVILAEQAALKAGGDGGATRSLDEQLARHRVTHLQCTPSFARLLTRMPATLAALRPLRGLLLGGEALPGDLAATLVRSIDGELINLYGPTETTVWSTVHRVTPDETGAGTVAIGRPIANTDAYILDGNRQPVPVGVPGELYLGGEGLARGYRHRPELTAEKFIPHPFSTGDARLYRTGDLARYRADGVIEFLGRADHQVKIRGHRVEPGEIEAMLARHPAVRQSVVVARADNPDDPRLAAYVVPGPSGERNADALREFMRGKLPGHMVPDHILFLESLPLTPNGKIDRRALPAPPARSGPEKSGGALPLAGLEQRIAAVWAEVLGGRNPGADENFFDFGGHSLQVVQVQGRLKEALGVELPVIKLFQYPTVRSLAGYLGKETKEDAFLHDIHERARRRRNAAAGRRREHAGDTT